jgi:Acetyltransferase (GNAT) family
MKYKELVFLADLNHAESLREIARWRTESEIMERNDLLLIAGGDSSPVTNSAIRVGDQAGPPAEEVLERVRNCFGPQNRGYSIHIRRHLDADLEDLCGQAKMVKVSESPGMAIHEPIRTKALPAGVECRSIVDKSGAVDFASILIDSYQSLGMPKESGEEMLKTPERMLRPYNYIVIAYLDKKPVSCAMVIFSHSIAGIYWVGTIQSARKKGLAEACTVKVTNEAFRRGASVVILQASKFGEPIYRRLGFQEFTRYPWYMYFQRR